MIKRQVIVVKTYCFKLYKAKRNKKLHKVIYKTIPDVPKTKKARRQFKAIRRR